MVITRAAGKLSTEKAENPQKSRLKSNKMNTMQFSEHELAALIKAANLMAVADGNVTDSETAVIKTDLKYFGVAEEETLKSLEHKANTLEGAEVISSLSNLSDSQKKYAAGYLAHVMEADGKIHPKEKDLWTLMSLLAGFPISNFNEAITFWRNNCH